MQAQPEQGLHAPAQEIQPAHETHEHVIEQEDGFIDEAIESIRSILKKPKKKKKVAALPQVKDNLTIHIEKIMEEGLADAYMELTAVQQQEFKLKGEETAFKIKELLRQTKVKIKEIFKLLVEWLRTLPGVNKYYIEQEAKIKADKLLALKEVTDAGVPRTQ